MGKYDYLKEQGVDVVYFPYGAGISSSSLKKRIYENYEKLQKKADNHLPLDAETKSTGKKTCPNLLLSALAKSTVIVTE